MENMDKLVGRSFEELSVEEMQILQGAGTAEPDSTPSIIVSVSLTVASGTLSGMASKAVSTLVTAAAKC